MTVGKHFLVFYLEVLRKLPVEKENFKIYHVSTRSDSTEKYYTIFMISVLCTVSSFTNYLLSVCEWALESERGNKDKFIAYLTFNVLLSLTFLSLFSFLWKKDNFYTENQ